MYVVVDHKNDTRAGEKIKTHASKFMWSRQRARIICCLINSFLEMDALLHHYNFSLTMSRKLRLGYICCVCFNCMGISMLTLCSWLTDLNPCSEPNLAQASQFSDYKSLG